MSTDLPTPTQTIDVRGKACPIPVITTAKTIRQLGLGDVLEILATDPRVEPNTQAWSPPDRQRADSIERTGDSFRVLVRKSK